MECGEKIYKSTNCNKKMKIVCFGAGECGNLFLKKLRQYGFENMTDIMFFCDSNVSEEKKKIGCYFIENPSILYDVLLQDCEIVVITSELFKEEIISQLLQMNISRTLIYSMEEYLRICYAKKIYKGRYRLNDNEVDIIDAGGYQEKAISKCWFNMQRIAIYTCITGNYDQLHNPEYVDEGIDYICFTNNHNLKSDIWNIEYLPEKNLDAIRLSRHVKLFPEKYLSGYDTSIWIDGKLKVMSDMRDYIRKYAKGQGVLCFPHFWRNSIYEEAATCCVIGKGEKEELLHQVVDYYNEGYPLNAGLYETSCIVRNHKDILVNKLMNAWWEQIVKYSYRDQLSLPYVCYKNNFFPDISDLYVCRCQYLQVMPHNKNRDLSFI